MSAADAASLILFRPQDDGASGAPALLMIERGAALAFGGGALAFPGGRVDPGDRAFAESLGDDAAALRIAAIRETIEEVGIAIGLAPAPDPPTVATLRNALQAGEPFARLLAEADLSLAPGALTPFARWRPAEEMVIRRFDARFYLAEAPAGALLSADGHETAAALWISAEDALAQVDAGARRMLFPTQRMLERLAKLGTLEAARADASGRPEVVVTPWMEEREGEQWICVPEGLGYPVTAAPVAGLIRH